MAAKASPSLKQLETAYIDAKETDPSKGNVYQSARNTYTDALKKANPNDYLDKRIEILQFDDALDEVFDSSKGNDTSALLKFVPFKETKQEKEAKDKSKKDKSEKDKSAQNVYDLFVINPTKDGEQKQGVYTGILSFDVETEKDTSTFEKKNESLPADDASFLSPFALYKIWIQKNNSYTLLRTLLSFLGEEKLKELDTILVNQFNEYDNKRKSTPGDREASAKKPAKPATLGMPTEGTTTRSGRVVIPKYKSSGGGRRTPRRRHLKQGGRNTKKRPRASQ